MPDTISLVPPWHELMLPTLQLLSDGATRHRKEIFDAVAKTQNISEEARAETLKSGGSRYDQRSSWVLSHLSRAKWVDRPQRGYYAINDSGRVALEKYSSGFDQTLVREIFGPLWEKKNDAPQRGPSSDEVSNETDDPVEMIEDAIARIEAEVGEELLERLRESHPAFFEQAVVDLLLKMGYGGADQRGRRIGGSHDGGIDGLIDRDPLGLEQVYIQAKRFQEGNNVGRESIQAFVGALHGNGASRGVFLTTSAFTPQAIEYARRIPSRIVLINGTKLVELMIAYRVGVQEKRKYSTLELDEDYFD